MGSLVQPGAQACRPAQDRTQVASGTKRVGAGRLSKPGRGADRHGFWASPQREGTAASQECVPELSGLVSGLGAPQGKKGVPQLQAV